MDNTNLNGYDLYDEDDFEFTGGARKVKLTYDLPDNFEKTIDGTYNKTLEFINNYKSDKYNKYLEDITSFYQQQKTKRNRDKFDFTIDDKGNLIKQAKDGTNKGYQKITPPKYEDVNYLINYMNQEINNYEYELRNLRDALIINSNADIFKEFTDIREKYIQLVNQKGIFVSYQDNVNGITKRNDELKKLSEQKYILREALRKLLEDIKIINLQEVKDKTLLDEKIKSYIIENNKINAIDAKIRELKTVKNFNSVILDNKDVVKDTEEDAKPKKVSKSSKGKSKKPKKKLKVIEDIPDKGPSPVDNKAAYPKFIKSGTYHPDKDVEKTEDVEEDNDIVKTKTEESIKTLRDIFSRPDKTQKQDDADKALGDIDELLEKEVTAVEETNNDEDVNEVEDANEVEEVGDQEATQDLEESDDDQLEAVELEGFDIEPEEEELRPLPKPVPEEEDEADQNINLDLSDIAGRPRSMDKKKDKKPSLSKKQASMLNSQLLNSPSETKKVSVTGLTIPIDKKTKGKKNKGKKLTKKSVIQDENQIDTPNKPMEGGEPESIKVTVSKLDSN